MTDLHKAMLGLNLAAKDTHEKALVAYYTDHNFHRETLADSVERLEKAIAEYKKESDA